MRLEIELGSRVRSTVIETEEYRPRGRPTALVMIALGIVLLVSVLFSATLGVVFVPLGDVLGLIVRQIPFINDWNGIGTTLPAVYESIILQIRLPRLILAIIVGFSLASAGASYQGLFRNPLADPYLIGVASGSGLGAVIALTLPLNVNLYSVGVVQWMAFGGGILAMLVVYGVARSGQATPTITLLLAGVAFSAFTNALLSFLLFTNQDKLHSTYTWLLGGLSLGSWEQIVTIIPYVVIGFGITYSQTRALNVLQFDEDQAAHLGVDIERVKIIVLIGATLCTASAVSVSGLIGFVGLIVPHIVRLIWGPDFRLLMPVAGIMGAIFLLWADTLARFLIAPTELPVGVVTAFCGAPFFLFLLRKRKSMGS